MSSNRLPDEISGPSSDTVGSCGGEAQRNDYRRALDQALERLATHPLIGQAREDLRPGLRSLPVRQHVIFHRVGPQTVTVIRVLHADMDAAKHLDE